MGNKSFYGCVEKDGHSYREPYVPKGKINQFYGKTISNIEEEFCKWSGTIFVFTFTDGTKMYLHSYAGNGTIGGSFTSKRPKDTEAYLETKDNNFHNSLSYKLYEELSQKV
jgi:hypothetical protein